MSWVSPRARARSFSPMRLRPPPMRPWCAVSAPPEPWSSPRRTCPSSPTPSLATIRITAHREILPIAPAIRASSGAAVAVADGMEAAERGNLETLRVLLSRGANPNAREANGGQTALMWAISERQSTVTEELVRGGADVHARSNSGFTALMFAAQHGDADSARVLLSAGANLNDIMSKTGLTPLIIAAAMGRTKVATLLLDKGANPEAVDTDGFTPLHHAARTKDASETVRSLLHHRAKPNVRLSQKKPTVAASGIVLQGATPLALAAEINNLDTVERRPSLPFAPAPKQPAPGHEHGRQGRCGLPITGGRLGRHDNATRAIDGDGARSC